MRVCQQLFLHLRNFLLKQIRKRDIFNLQGGAHMGIGNKLDTLLKERGMTVTELARRVGVAPTTIYSIIQRNNKKVDIDVLIKIARILGVNTEYFADSNDQSQTIAAHLDADDLTEAEMADVANYIAFLKSKRS